MDLHFSPPLGFESLHGLARSSRAGYRHFPWGYGKISYIALPFRKNIQPTHLSSFLYLSRSAVVVYELFFESSRDLEVKSVTQPLVCGAAVPGLGLYFSSCCAEQAGLAS